MVESVVQSHAEIVVESTEKLKIRVLHVDDELGLLKVAKQCLELQGPFHVDTVGSVEEALNKLKEKEYDAVVSDYQMPGKDGLQFLEMLRKNGNTIPFVMFTGKGREEVAIRALNLGANQYLNKTGETETVYTELAHAITELAKAKKGEELLRLSEERYKGLFENARDVIVLLDLKGNVTSANKGAEKYGFNKSEMLGKNMLKFVSKRYWPKLLSDVAQIALGKTAKGKIDIHTPKGDKIAEYRSNPIFSHGRVVGIQTILEDITARKKAEEELRESEEKFRDLFEKANDGLVFVDLSGRIVDVNQKAAEMAQKRKEDITGKSFLDLGLFSPKDLSVLAKRLAQQATAKPIDRFEFEIKNENGQSKSIEMSSTVIRKKDVPTGLLAIVRDVTERKKSEELLRESEERFRDLFESIQDPVDIYVGRQGRLIDYNTAFKEFMGYTDEELKDKTFLDFVHPDDRAMVLEKYQTKYSEEELPLVYEIRGMNKKREYIPLEISVSTYKKKGRVIGIEVIHRDITERKKAEESLRACGERFEKLFESQMVGVMISDSEGRISSANQTAAKTLGYSSPKELVGLVVADLFVDHKQRETLFEQLTDKSYARDFEIALKRKDDAQVCVRANVMLYKDAKGDVLRTECVFTEFSEHERIEEELKDLREKMDVLFEHAPDAYYLNDLRGKFISGNKAAEEMIGYSKTELIGKSFLNLKLLPRSQIPKAAKLLAMNALGKPTGPDELTLNRKDGTQVQVEIRTFPSKIKNRALVLGIARDVTERNRNEKMIIENQQKKFEGLFTGNPEATVHLNRDFHILDANPRFTSLFGYSLEEIKGKHIDDVIVPKNLTEEAEMLDKKAVDGYVYHDTVRARKDGSLVAVSISAAPILIQGQLTGYIGVYKDISELKKTEHQLAITNEKLRVVGGLTRHDVRNKLSAITGNAYLLKKQLADNKEVLDKVRDMETAVSQVTRIFDFAKDYEMLGVEELTYIDVQKSVNEAVQLFSGLDGVRILNECHGLTVLSDSLLRQLFYNLIDNSLKYGEKLSQIRIHYEKAEETQLRLIYEDNGIGISKDAKPKLFNEGFTTGKGSGYGLYLIGRMMDVYGWTISETGTHGKGAQFTINIPEAKPDGRQNYRLG